MAGRASLDRRAYARLKRSSSLSFCAWSASRQSGGAFWSGCSAVATAATIAKIKKVLLTALTKHFIEAPNATLQLFIENALREQVTAGEQLRYRSSNMLSSPHGLMWFECRLYVCHIPWALMKSIAGDNSLL